MQKKYIFTLVWVFIFAFACSDDKVPEENKDEDSKDEETLTYTWREWPLNHPCLVHTEADFDYVRSKVQAQAEPWYEGWQTLLNNNLANPSRNPSPVDTIVRTSSGGNYARVANDGAAAYQLALVWKISGDDKYAEASINVLNQWVNTCKAIATIDGHRILVAGFCGYQFANAAEIMRDYPGWSAEEFEAFKAWIVKVFYSHCYDFLDNHYGTEAKQAWLSWDLPAMLTLLSMGVLCDDHEMINYVRKYFYVGAGPGCIQNAVVAMHADPAGRINGENLGQSQEMGRDQAHATLNIPLLGYLCQTAYNNGEDLFACIDNRVLALCEYTAKYNVNPDEAIDIPYTPYYTLKEGWHNEISPRYRGRARPGWELIYNHYANVKGLNAPYSQEFAEKMRPENGGAQGGEQDDLGFGTLMYTRIFGE